MVLGQEILLIHLPFGPISRSVFARSPEPGQVEAVIGMDDEPDGFIQVFDGNVALIDPGDISPIHRVQ